MEDAIPEGQAVSAWLINSVYEVAPVLKKEEGKSLIKDFVEKSKMNVADLEKNHILDDCFYRIFVEFIKEIE